MEVLAVSADILVVPGTEEVIVMDLLAEDTVVTEEREEVMDDDLR